MVMGFDGQGSGLVFTGRGRGRWMGSDGMELPNSGFWIPWGSMVVMIAYGMGVGRRLGCSNHSTAVHQAVLMAIATGAV